MTPPDRTGGAGGVLAGGASIARAAAGPPVPESTAGAVDPHLAAPAVPELTAGAVAPETSAAPAVTHGGWAASLTLEKAHYVPAGPILDIWFGRPIALALDGWNALVDEQGLEDGATLPPCLTCSRALARLSAPSESGGQS